METFSAPTQYDDKYKDCGNFGSNRSACGLFALETASNFLETGEVNKETHEVNLMVAILNHIEKDIKGQITFEELLSHSKLKDKTTICTSVDLIKEKVLGYEHIFKADDYSKPYCIIFLKNSKFFNVLYNPSSHYKYYVRDCHEIDQYSYASKVDLINHLNTVYKFNENINLDGYEISEFSSIEFKVIDEKFTNDFKISQMDLGVNPDERDFLVDLNITDDSIFDPKVDPTIKNIYIESLSNAKEDMKMAMKLQEEEFQSSSSNTKSNFNTSDDINLAKRLQEDEYKKADSKKDNKDDKNVKGRKDDDKDQINIEI
jgi:hypothetical protein